MDLSIIIVNWNSAEYLNDCLASIYAETKDVAFEVIVVDNASFDGSREVAARYGPGVRFVQSEQNLGFARANNLGATYSSADSLLFLNPDTVITKQSLGQMLNRLWSDPHCGAVGPKLLNSDGSLQDSCVQTFPTILNQLLDTDLLRRAFPRSRLWGTDALYGGNPQVDVISGACFMVKRKIFEEVGGFSEEYFMYADDLDLSFKIHKAGCTIIYAADCEVIHHGGKSSARQSSCFADVLQRQSICQFLSRRRGDLYARCYRLCTAFIAVCRLAIIMLPSFLTARALGGKERKSVLQKWAKILTWALGLTSSESFTKAVAN